MHARDNRESAECFEEFDAAYARIGQRGIEHCADPRRRQPGTINRDGGGRGVYFRDPAGHAMELITVPYGGRTTQAPAPGAARPRTPTGR